jgi:hydroxymethylpyrimidine pyrophosphatase-like HAD family hydrolase
MVTEFKDNANRPIIAFDFDGTLTTSNTFPEIGQIRNFASEVTQFLHNIGVVIIIWTCRDRSDPDPIRNKNRTKHDDIEPIIHWMDRNHIWHDAINNVIQYAPFHYEARKIYAHMYVDDKGFGWYDHEDVLLEVLRSFLVKVLGVKEITADIIVTDIEDGEEVDKDATREARDCVHRWRL